MLGLYPLAIKNWEGNQPIAPIVRDGLRYFFILGIPSRIPVLAVGLVAAKPNSVSDTHGNSAGKTSFKFRSFLIPSGQDTQYIHGRLTSLGWVMFCKLSEITT
jgi:hypothetical protein